MLAQVPGQDQPKPAGESVDINNPKPKPRRAFAPKVRTGCYTCKVRRVKCDETKPACLRCTKTGRRCDGYVAPSTIVFEIKDADGPSVDGAVLGPAGAPTTASQIFRATGPTLAPSISSGLYESRVEARSFQFFREITGPALGSFTAPYIWDVVVPQYCHDEPAIRHLVHAVAISHEATHESLFQSPDSDPKWLQDPRRRVFTDHYTKALGRLSRQSSAPVSLEAVLLACLLFISVENFQSKPAVANGHVRSGVKIVKEWKAKNRKLDALHGPSTNSSDALIRDYLAPMFETLGHAVDQFAKAQAAAEPDPNIEISTRKVPSIPDYYSNFLDASKGMDRILSYLFSNQTNLLLLPEQRETVMKVVRMDKVIAQWDTALGCSEKRMTPQNVALLRIHRSVLKILLGSYAHPTETIYDEYKPELEELVSACEKVMATSRTLEEEEKDDEEGLGIIPPLFMVGVSCRDPQLRRKAIGLLHLTGREEGAWDSCIAANVARSVMLVEERGYGVPEDAGTILSSSRIRPISASFHPHDGKTIMLYLRPPFTKGAAPTGSFTESAPRPGASEDAVVDPGKCIMTAGYQGIVPTKRRPCACPVESEITPLPPAAL